jgi:hypothetical protein
MTVMLLYCPVLIIQILVTLRMGNVQHLAKNPFGTLVLSLSFVVRRKQLSTHKTRRSVIERTC